MAEQNPEGVTNVIGVQCYNIPAALKSLLCWSSHMPGNFQSKSNRQFHGTVKKDPKSSSISVSIEKIASVQLASFIIENIEQLNFHQG